MWGIYDVGVFDKARVVVLISFSFFLFSFLLLVLVCYLGRKLGIFICGSCDVALATLFF